MLIKNLYSAFPVFLAAVKKQKLFVKFSLSLFETLTAKRTAKVILFYLSAK